MVVRGRRAIPAPTRPRPSRIISAAPRVVVPPRWVDLAVHYYVGARAAKVWQHRPNADIQAHHAVEMAMKWALVRPLGGPHPWNGRTTARTIEEVRKKGHNLMALWALINADYPGHRLGQLGRYVQLLNRVETLVQRYASMPSARAISYVDRLEDIGGSNAESYAIDLPRLDELFHGLLALARTDRLVMRSLVVPRWPEKNEAEDYYRRDNPAAVTW